MNFVKSRKVNQARFKCNQATRCRRISTGIVEHSIANSVHIASVGVCSKYHQTEELFKIHMFKWRSFDKRGVYVHARTNSVGNPSLYARLKMNLQS